MADEGRGPELFFGLVSASGTDLNAVSAALDEALRSVRYTTVPVRLSKLLADIPGMPPPVEAPEDDRIEQQMEAGTRFREKVKRGDALAAWGLVKLREERQKLTGDEKTPSPDTAYVIRSLKRLEEAQLLRRLYGSAFILISAYAPRARRVDALARRIADSRHDFNTNRWRARAEELINKDEMEVGRDLGQNVSKVFPKADVFIDASKPAEEIVQAVQRFIELLFGNPFRTPTRDEFGMFQAHAAALRSADLSRQVGAAIATKSGEVVALGTNDVPKAGGGLYWAGDDPDMRDYRLGRDPSHHRLRSLLADVFERQQNAKWFVADRSGSDVDRLVDEALYGNEDSSAVLRGSQVLSITEFFRAVHAEMAAVTDAARRGVTVTGCVLYSTTFPCHDCAKHIVAAGIDRVVYVEPYPKSLVGEMYHDSIAVDKPDAQGRVHFEPFVGLAPVRYTEFFTPEDRKTARGDVQVWNARRANGPRLMGVSGAPIAYLLYITQEDAAIQDLLAGMRAAGLPSDELPPIE